VAHFKNSARRLEFGEHYWVRSDGCYTYDKPSPYLILWSRLLQSVVSQAATKVLTGKFHNGHCSIYKAEGRCCVHGYNDLVLSKNCCYWDFGGWGDNELAVSLRQISDMVSHIVLEWNPNDPIQSMLSAAAEFSQTLHKYTNSFTVEELDAAVHGSSVGGVFGGDALSAFFDHDPFGKFPTDRKYQRFCLTEFNEMTDAVVDQKFADEDLGEKLLEDLREAQKVGDPSSYTYMLACSPQRDKNSLKFWLNDGVYYGWHNMNEIIELCDEFRNGTTSRELSEKK